MNELNSCRRKSLQYLAQGLAPLCPCKIIEKECGERRKEGKILKIIASTQVGLECSEKIMISHVKFPTIFGSPSIVMLRKISDRIFRLGGRKKNLRRSSALVLSEIPHVYVSHAFTTGTRTNLVEIIPIITLG